MTSLGSVFRTMYVVSEQWQEDIGLSFYEHLHFPVSLCVIIPTVPWFAFGVIQMTLRAHVERSLPCVGIHPMLSITDPTTTTPAPRGESLRPEAKCEQRLKGI